MSLYCGIDLHAKDCYLCVIDEQDRIQLRKKVPNHLPTILHELSAFCPGWGRIDPERMDFGDTAVNHAFGAPPAVFSPFFSVTASCFRETLTLCTGFCETSVQRSNAEHLLNLVENEVAKATHETRKGARSVELRARKNRIKRLQAFPAHKDSRKPFRIKHPLSVSLCLSGC